MVTFTNTSSKTIRALLLYQKRSIKIQLAVVYLSFWDTCFSFFVRRRGIAQLVEQWSPKPRAEGSSPSTPAIVVYQILRMWRNW